MTTVQNRPEQHAPVVSTNASVGSSRSLAGIEDRMLTLAYLVAHEIGYSPRATARLCRRLSIDAAPWLRASIRREDVPNVGRDVRARYLRALRSALGHNVNPELVDTAVKTAVLVDELTLLPPRQQLVVRLAVVQRCTVREIGERTGWTEVQILRLLRSGLRTIAVCGQMTPAAAFATTGWS